MYTFKVKKQDEFINLCFRVCDYLLINDHIEIYISCLETRKEDGSGEIKFIGGTTNKGSKEFTDEVLSKISIAQAYESIAKKVHNAKYLESVTIDFTKYKKRN